ncbi:excinuclease ABC subunit C [Chryseobacterium sp. 6424]|uniref:GIY-YIG nuclease family protein n=1 Tax=Chryseobacterium sp. 6424 TaxID=2039166 RepID=UPI000EFBC3DD|nr:excinuclease ABC subunit C [Chryseobacterium sp. 6424]
MPYFVYILYSAELDVYNKGFSTDVSQRLEYHLKGLHKFTSSARDWKIVYTAAYQTKKEALIEEKRLKRLNRTSILKLISGYNAALSSRHA